MDDDEFRKLLKKSGDATSKDYPKDLEKSRRDQFIRRSTSRTWGGCIAVLLIIISVVYLYGKIVGWW